MPKAKPITPLTKEQQEVVETNQRLVWFVIDELARKRVSPLSRKDQFQEGAIGLMRAAVGYKPAVGAFSTYAVEAIRRHIQAAEMSAGMIRLPKYIQETAFKGHRNRKHAESLGRMLSLNSSEEVDAFHPVSAPTCGERIDAAERRAAIKAAMSRLTEAERDVFASAALKGMTNADVARDRGTHVCHVRKAKLRAKIKLQEMLREYA